MVVAERPTALQERVDYGQKSVAGTAAPLDSGEASSAMSPYQASADWLVLSVGLERFGRGRGPLVAQMHYAA